MPFKRTFKEKGRIFREETCPNCHESGIIMGQYECPECFGKGTITYEIYEKEDD